MNENLQEDKIKTEDEIKQQALVDNTAQEIFNHLKEIENKPEVYDKRWTWELLQNALDAATQDRKIEVEIIQNDNELTFTHNGRPFKPEEVAHLIYHGSTKRGQDIGKFGTGFLTTHLLSRKVNVSGFREDNKQFRFTLDREGSSSDEIKKGMEETWEQYQESLDEIEKIPDRVVKFEYPLDNVSSYTVKAGIDELTIIAPYVLAFNDKLGAIKITGEVHNVRFELVSQNNETAYITKVVKEECEGKPPTFHELWIVKDDEVEIAIKGKRRDNRTCEIGSLQNVPKIFLAFPLFGTQDLPFPAVVNSRKFEATGERDGIFLGEKDTDDIERNKKLLENASDLFIKLISDSDCSSWENVHTLLNLGKPPDKEWLDPDWYIDLLKKLINEIMNERVVKIENGSLVPYTGTFIPVVDSLGTEKLGKLWDLCHCLSTYKGKIPAKRLVVEWAEISDGWKSLGLDLTEREITIEKIAEEIAASENIANFQTQLSGDLDALRFLNDFYNIILNANKQTLFDSKNILPNQNGTLMNRTTLFRDEGIDESLKDISKKLGEDIKEVLLHLEVSENVKNLLQGKKQEEILTQVVSKIKQPCPDDDQYIQANLELAKWLMENDKFDCLEGYPLLSCKEKIYTSAGKENKEKLLAPKEIWDESARIHASLFPQEFIISSLYHEKISQKDKWDKLENMGLILVDPLYKESEKLQTEVLGYLLLSNEKLEEEKEHEVIDNVTVSKIAFLETRDKGIIDTIRKSKDKALRFLNFLFDYVVEVDNYWDTPIEVECKCGSKHQIYPALWMSTLKDRSWVPIRKDKSEKLSSQYLAPLFEGSEELLERCRQDEPSRLLSRLNISVGELMMHIVAKDDEVKLELDMAMGSLYSTFMTNPGQLSKIAQIAESDTELFVKEIEERIQIRELVRRNQRVGSLVENILKDVLEKEGFKVERTGTGSDFVIEHDFVKDNVEMTFEIRKEDTTYLYIEVKATTQDFVRMTFTQAKEARDKSDKYVLCFIRLGDLGINEENIKSHARFVTDIGQKIQDKVGEAENWEEKQEAIVISGDIEIEINEGPIRFKINKRVWEEGQIFKQFLEVLRVPEHE